MARPLLTRLALPLLMVLLLTACGPSRGLLRDAAHTVSTQQSTDIECTRADRCASTLLFAEQLAHARRDPSVHYAQTLERGEDSLLLRLHLIRSAQQSIDLQTYILAEDEAGYLVLNELLMAARRGVHVRVLLDQLFSVDNPGLLARLALQHSHFELRMYNPTFNKARTSTLEFAGGILCCLSRFHHRMHNKLLLIDGEVGVTGGRNYQNRYFDWDPNFNYLDRDVLVLGPASAQMARSFEQYWSFRKSVPAKALTDVARYLVDPQRQERISETIVLTRAHHITTLLGILEDPEALAQRLDDGLMQVASVRYYSDRPGKHFGDAAAEQQDLTREIRQLVLSSEQELLLQTPYLVLSRSARRNFRRLRRAQPDLRIAVASNSLAATDHFVVYAITTKYRRRFVLNLGFDIYELMPYPAVATHRVVNLAALSEEAQQTGQERGTRVGGHAKSIVIDRNVVMIGSHNFDPRSDNINTESGVIIRDAAFAARVAANIEQDMAGDSAWVINHREEVPVLSRFSRSVARFSESLPIFDLWPYRYTTSYQLRDGYAPVPRDHPEFFNHYQWVGDYPEVETPLRPFKTWFVGAFGDFAVPIL